MQNKYILTNSVDILICSLIILVIMTNMLICSLLHFSQMQTHTICTLNYRYVLWKVFKFVFEFHILLRFWQLNVSNLYFDRPKINFMYQRRYIKSKLHYLLSKSWNCLRQSENAKWDNYKMSRKGLTVWYVSICFWDISFS